MESEGQDPMTPSEEQRPLKCDCLQQSGHLYTPHSPKCSADNIEVLAADRDRLAERVKELSEALGKCDAARSCAVLERKDIELRLATYDDEHKRDHVLSEEVVTLAKRLATAEADNAALILEIQHLGEYWNGNANERAMQNACEHVQEECDKILSAAHPGTALTQRLAATEKALKVIVNITDGHPINTDRRDRIHSLAKQALEGK